MMDDYWTHRRHGHNFMRRNREVIDPQGHATDMFTGWACEYLAERAKAGGPFFLYLAYNAPHDPIQPPPEWLAKVKQREPGMTEKRAEARRADRAPRRRHRPGAGRRSTAPVWPPNTLVIFTSTTAACLPTAPTTVRGAAASSTCMKAACACPGMPAGPA